VRLPVSENSGTLADHKIRILEADDQRRGDLFGRLMQDLFHALGYHEFTLNIPKSGREVDLRGRHRTSDHGVLAECKATQEPVGGSDLNKFAGVLQMERARADGALEGYFVSLNGFRASALEQEGEAESPRFVLLTGPQVVSELVLGNIIVSPETAAAAAGKCLASQPELGSTPHLELLAHPAGWCWCAIFSQNGTPKAFVLIHADGAPLGGTAAAAIVNGDAAGSALLRDLALVVPDSQTDSEASLASASTAYQAFLMREFGRITVDGLPADEHLGAKSIALPDLFVPAHLQRIESPTFYGPPEEEGDEASNDLIDDESDGFAASSSESGTARETLGAVMSRGERIAVLGPPGSGKSTLLKRLALAYGVPDKRTEIDDQLPDRAWLPLALRCRQLGDLASHSIHDVLRMIPEQAEMPQHTEAFRLLTESALREGAALILVDGLDEIADPQVRLVFVKQLRTFIGTYPQIQLVVTSREAGFRIVAGALCDVSSSYRVAEFDADDITRLTHSWTMLAVGDTEAAASEAAEIARTIITTDRVRRLARNPLLLTTLLLVRRWVGDLPKRRTALYAKAIEVLLMTWNVEGHQPIDLDDAMPQLAYVAFAMTRSKTQVLSRPRLVALLEEARRQMPEVLGHSALGAGQFLERIEDRSSLLSLSGHGIENGVLVALYEFKHLTFQEYLTAVAIADGYYPDRKADEAPETVIGPHFAEPQWLEIIPITGVLVGRRATPIVEALVRRVLTDSRDANILARCLADEVQIPPRVVSEAADALSGMRRAVPRSTMRGVIAGKYGTSFRDAVVGAALAGRRGYWHPVSLLSDITAIEHVVDDQDRRLPDWLRRRDELIAQADSFQCQTEGCLITMVAAFEGRRIADPRNRAAAELSAEVLYHLEASTRPCLSSESPAVRWAAAWAYAWLGQYDLDGRRFVSKVLPLLYSLWRSASALDVKRHMAWAFCTQPMIVRSAKPLGTLTSADSQFLEKEVRARQAPGPSRADRKPAALVASYYLGGPYKGPELRRMVSEGALYPITRTRLLRRRL
jgi:energy-coupling factor transporter ATP-binding protein EcfA2